jgi:hypothetical protein
VVEGDPRFNTGCQEGVYDLMVKGDAGGIRLAAALRKDTRPRNRKPKSGDMQLSEELNVLKIAMVEVARDIAGFAAVNFSRAVDKVIPDGRAFAIGLPAAFNLIGGDGNAPVKVRAEILTGNIH